MGLLIQLVFSVTPEFNSVQETFVDHLQCSIYTDGVLYNSNVGKSSCEDRRFGFNLCLDTLAA